MRPVFADPKTDFVFKKLFGTEQHNDLTPQEWDAYDRARLAEQDARGALSLAHPTGSKQGHDEGLREGLRRAIEEVCEVLTICLSPEQRAELRALEAPTLETRLRQLKRDRRWG